MPINYKDYPPDWKQIRERILERDKHQCQHCGLKNYSLVASYKGYWVELVRVGKHFASAKEARNYLKEAGIAAKVVVLTIMHLNHDITDNRDKNLLTGCQRCHLIYDKDLHQKNAKRTRLNKQAELQQELWNAERQSFLD